MPNEKKVNVTIVMPESLINRLRATEDAQREKLAGTVSANLGTVLKFDRNSYRVALLQIALDAVENAQKEAEQPDDDTPKPDKYAACGNCGHIEVCGKSPDECGMRGVSGEEDNTDD